jgi:hypothetical protein
MKTMDLVRAPPAAALPVCVTNIDEMKGAPVALVPPALSSTTTTSRPLGMSIFERRAVTGLVSSSGDEMERYVADRASAYASGSADVRRRALARAAAVQDVLLQELSALLSAAIARRDDRAVSLLDRTLNSATTRYRALLDQLRTECAPTRRIVMRATGDIAVAAEER